MRRFFLSLVLSIFCLPALSESLLTIEEGWVREGPPTAKVLAGFMVMKNSGDEPVELTHAESDDFESVEMHRTVIEDGVASMIKQDSFIVPAKGELVLEPGSYHLMLIGAKRSFKAGDTIDISLSGKGDDCMKLSLTVKKGGNDDMADHDHHHHHH